MAWSAHTHAGGGVADGPTPHPHLTSSSATSPRRHPTSGGLVTSPSFATGDGKLYVAAILDLHDRSVVGWSMRERATNDLVIDALVMAIGRRRPEAEVVHHSDRGSVYTSLRFANHLEDYGLVVSFGSTGDAYDNAAMEAFWATLKRELAWIHHRDRWPLRGELRAALFDYIEAFYNRARHQAGLDHRSPAEVYAATAAA